MPRIIVETPFKFSPDGIQVVEIAAGEQWVSDRCATVAIEHLKLAELSENQDPDAEPDSDADKAPHSDAETDLDAVPDPGEDTTPEGPVKEEAPSTEAPAEPEKPAGKKTRTDKR